MEKIMKKTFTAFLILILLTAFSGAAGAAERIVQLTIPGCAAWGAAHRIGAILKEIKGVSKYQFQENNLLVITFDDKIVTLNVIIGELNKGGNKIKGEPVYLKQN